jgi:hypothetical protein
VVNFFLTGDAHAAKRTAAAALARLLDDTGAAPGPTPPVRLVADRDCGSAVAAALKDLGADVEWGVPAAGALLPVLHLVRGLARPGPPQLVATAYRDGTCALALIHPAPR